MPPQVQSAIERWTKDEGNYLFALITNGKHPHVHIDRSIVRRVREECDSLPQDCGVDVILDSSGGDVEAAHQLVTYLRSRCGKLRVFVPDWAKSAATYFCLGADEIWMGRTAELGPLDAQIPDPRHPDEYISALEEFKAMDYLRQYAFEMLDAFVILLTRRTRMRVRDLLQEARPFVTDLMAPLYGQVDPLYFGSAHRALDMAVEYGSRLMRRYAYSDWTDESIQRLLDALTWTYPSHSFVIDYEEAERLGLRVKLLEGQRDQDARTIATGLEAGVGIMNSDALSRKSTRASGKRSKK